MKERTRQWWGGDLHGDLFDAGVAGIWNDMNEPSCFLAIRFPMKYCRAKKGGKRLPIPKYIMPTG